MIELYSPRGEMDLLLLRSILDDAGILFFVHNDTFGSLYPGRYAEAYNRKIVYVSEVDLGEARVLLREFLERTGQAAHLEREAEPPPLVGLLQQTLERACRRWPPHQGGPLARGVWKRLSGWGLWDGPDETRRGFRLIRNDHPLPVPAPADDRGGEDGDERRSRLRLV